MKKNIYILTLFPEYFSPLLECGITGSALRSQRSLNLEFHVELVNIRDYSPNNYKNVDDSPYGGGPGMVLRADVLANALEEAVFKTSGKKKSDFHIVCPSPRGEVLNHKLCREFGTQYLASDQKDLVFICGRYEGIDERFLDYYVDQFISVGDYVLTGGELAVMTLLDASIRFVPGILGNKCSSDEDSFEDGLIECPQYTRPREFNGLTVPEVLMNGDHAKIKAYQLEEKIRMTQKFRPDLLRIYKEKF